MKMGFGSKYSGRDPDNKKPYLIEGTRSIMGTSVAIAAVHPNVDEAKEAVSLAFEQVRRIEDLMSIYKQDSEVSMLNKNGFIGRATVGTILVIKKSLRYSELSEGAFSTCVLPLLDLWEEKLRAGKFPTETEINSVLEFTDYRNIALDGGNVQFRKSGMRITLGGIAKGYAVDRAIEVLCHEGVNNTLVSAGGDIRALGEKARGVPWRIAVRDPQDKRRSITVVELRDQAIATSGSYERHIGREMKVSHIVNSRTGQPAQGLLSTSIITKNAIDADALSTVVFLLGVERGMELVERLDGVEALVITGEGKVIRSSGFQRYESS